MYEFCKSALFRTAIALGYNPTSIVLFMQFIRNAERPAALRAKHIPWWQLRQRFNRWLELTFDVRVAGAYVLLGWIVTRTIRIAATWAAIAALCLAPFAIGALIGHYLWR